MGNSNGIFMQQDNPERIHQHGSRNETNQIKSPNQHTTHINSRIPEPNSAKGGVQIEEKKLKKRRETPTTRILEWKRCTCLASAGDQFDVELETQICTDLSEKGVIRTTKERGRQSQAERRGLEQRGHGGGSGMREKGEAGDIDARTDNLGFTLKPSFEGGRQPRQRNLGCLSDEVAAALSACANHPAIRVPAAS